MNCEQCGDAAIYTHRWPGTANEVGPTPPKQGALCLAHAIEMRKTAIDLGVSCGLELIEESA